MEDKPQEKLIVGGEERTNSAREGNKSLRFNHNILFCLFFKKPGGKI